jgi:hypothetical protein
MTECGAGQNIVEGLSQQFAVIGRHADGHRRLVPYGD